MTQPEFKTPEEVAALCRVTRRAVYDWLRDGKLRGYRAGTRWLVKPADLDAFLTGNAAPGGQVPAMNEEGTQEASGGPQQAVDSSQAGSVRRPPDRKQKRRR